MQPIMKRTIGKHVIEEYWSGGERLVYIDGHIVLCRWAEACEAASSEAKVKALITGKKGK
jgi:hypothetical protein